MTTEKQPKSLIIVESPSKARTLGRYLGDRYRIEASVGHIRDLPTREMGVDPEHDFTVTYVNSPDKKKVIANLRKAVKAADNIYLATDPDREGEAISWHLLAALGIKGPAYRLIFHEFTREAIQNSFTAPREIDERLVKAQETRRILDRLVGYGISPILWRKIAPKLSAGRVQSVAIRLVVDRERARWRFTSSEYWDVTGTFNTSSANSFAATLISFNGQRLVNGKDFDRTTGELKTSAAKNALLMDEPAAQECILSLKNSPWSVTFLEQKPASSNPAPPFTTSTLQQEAYRKFRFSAKRTMQVAQRLYEGGFITYMRTDSTALSAEALASARRIIQAKFGEAYLPAKPRVYRTKVKNAQEAHEAIRPAGSQFQDPATVTALEKDAFRLYDLIFKRTIASQMKAARLRRTVVNLSDGTAVFEAQGKVVEFPGYMAVYQEGKDDENGEDGTLPPLKEGDTVACTGMEAQRHETKPAARYTEATLVKELESLGIGRPSTYASIMDTIQRREYVIKQNGALIPTFIAIAVVRLMEKYFAHLVDYQFTARMEDILDGISRGEEDSLPYLKRFYFGGNGDQGLQALMQAEIDPRESCTIVLGLTEDNVPVTVRVGKYGPYIEHGEQRANLDLDIPPAELTLHRALAVIEKGSEFPRHLGDDPATGLPVYLKQGRFGFYLQLGSDDDKKQQKSLLPGMHPEDVNLASALDILGLPKELGRHPETGEAVLVDLGRYGPYVRSGKLNQSLPRGSDVLAIGLEEAVAILASKRSRTPEVIRVIGAHPDTGASIEIRKGRYGLYLTDGKTNAPLRKGTDTAAIDLAEAVESLRRRAAEKPARRRYYRKKK